MTFPCRVYGERAGDRSLVNLTVKKRKEMDGAEAQSRTGDTGLFRAVLYRLSYLGTVAGTTGFEPAISGVTIQRLRPDWTTSP